MIKSFYLYSFFILFGISLLIYLFFNIRNGKNQISNKIILKNLLESLDLDLPEELKSLDNSSADPQKFSQFDSEFNLMSKFNFDDTETSGIWWSTNIAIKDLCLELKEDTNCKNSEKVELLIDIAQSIDINGL